MDNDDLFEINSGFFCQNTRFTIAPVIRERQDTQRKKIREGIEMDKASVIKAAAVRVLKMKNRAEQTVLEKDVVQALAPYFRAEIPMIRHEIGILESDSYLTKQVVGNKMILTYMA
jgi:hypothetical protein